MKIQKFNKIMGVLVTITMLLSMLLATAVPAHADNLVWGTESIPGSVINKTQVSDFAVGKDGTTIYAVGPNVATAPANEIFFKSTNGGGSWTATPGMVGTARLVAVAPDDVNVVAYVDTTTNIFLSTSAGATALSFNALAASGLATITDIALSPSVGGVRQLVVAGTDGVGTGAGVASFALGGFAGWVDMTAGVAPSTWASTVLPAAAVGTASVNAISFSPNYLADRIITAVSSDSATGNVFFNIGSFATTEWNTAAGFADYLGTTASTGLITTGVGAITSAAIALAPTYAGADGASRVAFVAVDAGAAAVASSGIFRMDDAARTLRGPSLQFASVAYNGTDLVGGVATSNAVYRTSEPLATTAMVATNAGQRPSGGPMANLLTNTMVAFAGTNVVAINNGNESAFAVSKDKGVSFNDVSFINTTITNTQDIAVAADGAKWYMVSDDGPGPAPLGDVSLWRKDGTTWVRLQVLVSPVAPITYGLRMAPENAAVVFMANLGGTSIYYTDDSGEKNFSTRVTTDVIVDVVAESATVLYAAGATTIRKSTDSGFLWSDPSVSFGLASGNAAYNIKSLAKDKLIVGTTQGVVAYSADGGVTWSRLSALPGISTAAGAFSNVQATAKDLATGDFVYAAYDGTVGSKIYRFKLGSPTGTAWDTLNIPAVTVAGDAYAFTGMKLVGTVLYAIGVEKSAGVDTLFGTADDVVSGSNVTRSLNPAATAATSVSFSKVVLTGHDFGNVAGRVNNLATSTGNKIWAIHGRPTSTEMVHSFTDTLADPANAPKMTGPADKAAIAVNPVSGDTLSVVLTWERPSLATAYEVQVAFDKDFNQILPLLGTSFAPADPATSPVAYLITGGTLNFDTTYFWRVRATAPLQSPFPTTPNSFVVGSPLVTAPSTTVNLNAPVSGATGVALSPAFSWQAVKDAKTYEIQVADNPAFTTPVISNATLTTNVFVAPAPLAASKVYYWRVRAVVGTVTGAYTTDVFTTMTPAPPATTQAPQPTPTITVNVPAPPPATTPGYIWAIIAIGAILIIAVLILVMRTGRKA